MSTTTVHVFSGSFASREDATDYSEAQWAPEPGEDASEEEYAAWEDSNPAWAMRDDLGLDYLDHDFIETIRSDEEDKQHIWNYLGGLLRDPATLERIRAQAGSANTLVLIFAQALDGAEPDLGSTPKLAFCGTHTAHW
ncbi:MAG: hypothetical protein H6721_24105 [Sandaracinus sp.]|nr:hypothetical protein [Sandaracinus sp.]MCB9635217.1 hypothetical protein [Sandaracinus sp.]